MARRVAACRPIRAALPHLLARHGIPMALALVAIQARADCEATIFERPDHVAFDGCIDEQSARQLIRALDRRPTVPLLVKSGGGAVNAAVEVATVIASHRTRLIIRGQCLSSCANYWLPAATAVDVEEGSAIGFHGDARTTYAHAPHPQPFSPDAQRGMALVLEQEAALGRVVSRVEDLHALQVVRMSDAPVRVRLQGLWQTCPGLGLPAVWAPTLARLQALGFVSRIVQRNDAVAPDISSAHDVHPMSAADDDSDPSVRCVCTDAS